MKNRRWFIVAAIAMAAVALVAWQLATTRSATRAATGTGFSSGAVVPGAGATSASDGSTDGAATSSAVTATAPGTTPKTPPAMLPPGLSEKPVAPHGVERPGTALTRLTSGPSDLISGMALDRLPAGATYGVRIRPLGYGPGAESGPTLIVIVDSIAPIGGAPEVAELRGKNMLLVMDTRDDGLVSLGGTYRGVVTFTAAGKRLVPLLGKVVDASE